MVDGTAHTARVGPAPDRPWRDRLVGALHLLGSLALSLGYLVPAFLLTMVVVAVTLASVGYALDAMGAPAGALFGARNPSASGLLALVLALPPSATTLARFACWAQRSRMASVFGVVETRVPDPVAPRSAVARVANFVYGRDAWASVVHSTVIGAQGLLAGGLTVGLLVNGIASSAGSLLGIGYVLTVDSPRPGDVAADMVVVVAGLASAALGAWLVTPLVRFEVWLTRQLLFNAPEVRMRRRLVHVTDSRSRMVDAAEAERRRIERDLHDGAQQRLLSVTMTLTRARAKFDRDPQRARALLDEARAEAKTVMAELREVARGLHPSVLTDHGLGAALPVAAGRCPVTVRVDVALARRPSARAEGVAYYVACEALTNVAKHAGAGASTVRAERVDGDTLRITVIDDGKGGADPDAGTGLYGLWDRVNAVDGTLAVRSPEGEGTVLTADIPWEA